MLRKQDIERVAERVWEIPRTFHDDMRVPGSVEDSQGLSLSL